MKSQTGGTTAGGPGFLKWCEYEENRRAPHSPSARSGPTSEITQDEIQWVAEQAEYTEDTDKASSSCCCYNYKQFVGAVQLRLLRRGKVKRRQAHTLADLVAQVGVEEQRHASHTCNTGTIKMKLLESFLAKLHTSI